VPQADAAAVFSYLSALKRETAFAGAHFNKAEINTVYIGGGTPSILEGAQIRAIAEAVYKAFPYSRQSVEEFSIECNPESLDESKLQAYKEAGINRVSLGVQSLDDNNLQSTGRLHNAAQAVDKIKLALKYFDNVSADLIVGLPYDTEEIVKKETETLASLVRHLSIYELTLAEGTPYKKSADEGTLWLPDDDETQDLFDAAADTAENMGFKRYEISNFALNGMVSKHNYGYWTREEYIGLGAGAYSLIKTADGSSPLANEIRFASPKDIHAYIGGINCVDAFDKVPRTDFELLDEKGVENERIMLGLRTSEGVEKEILENRLTDEIRPFFTETDKGKLALNRRGAAVMNSVLVKLL
jgi:oxygen-independent coproporphyrinogen-3 oxidase